MSDIQGVCPKCGSANIDYETLVDDGHYDNCVYYPAHCDSCGTDFKEVYNFTFAFNEIEKEEV